MAAHARRESALEKLVIFHAKKLKLECYKFTSPGRRGVPDRMFINARGRVAFLELKAPGNKPTMVQVRELNILQRRGVIATWSSQLTECQEFLDTFAEL
jgi:hypothetical protein